MRYYWPMSRMVRRPFLGLVVVALAISSAQVIAADKDKKFTYDDDIVPIFRNSCFGCHNTEKARADLDLSTYQGIMTGSAGGEVVKAGDAASSKLYLVMAHLAEPKMPPKANKLPDPELDIVRKWIDGGMLEKAGAKAKVSNKPKVDLSLSSAPVGKPTGPAAFPKDFLLEPAVRTPRAFAVMSIAASPWAPVVAVAGQKQVILYHSETLEPVGILPFPEGSVNVLKFSRGGQLLMAAGGHQGKSGKAVVWNVADGSRVFEVGNETDAILAADISADQSQIAIGGPSKLVKIFSTKDGELLQSIKKHTDWVTALEFSVDGVLLASGDRAGNLQVWESNTAREFYSLRGHTAAITAVSWRDDSNILISASEDTTIRMWEMQNGGQVKSWGAHGGGVTAVDFAHDGRIISTGRDRAIKIWDANGNQQRVLEAFGDLGLSTAFSHDNARVICGDWSGDVRVYSTADGKRLGSLSANPPTLAERIDMSTKKIAELTPVAKKEREAMADAAAKFVAAQKTAAQAKVLAEQLIVIHKSADSKFVMLKQSTDQLKLQLAAAQADVQKRTTELKQAEMATAAAKTEMEQAAAAAKIAADALARKVSVAQKLVESAAQAKAEVDQSPKNPKLVELATRAKQAADQAAAVVLEAQTEAVAKSADAKAKADKASKFKTDAEKVAALIPAAQKLASDYAMALKPLESSVSPIVIAAQKAKQEYEASAKALSAAEELSKGLAAASQKAAAQCQQTESLLALETQHLAVWKAGMTNVELAKAKQQLGNKETLLTTKADVIRRIEAEIAKAQSDVVSIKKFVVDSPAALKQKQAAIEGAKQAVAPKQKIAAAAQAVVAEREAVLKGVQQTAAKLQAEAAKAPARKELTLAAAKMKESADLLGADLVKAQTELKVAQAEVAKATQAVAASEQDLAKAKAEVESAPKRIAETESHGKQLAERLSAAKLDAAKASQEIAPVKQEVERIAREYQRMLPKNS